MNCSVIILAAGKGTRMKSSRVKVLHPLCSRPMLAYSLDLASQLAPNETIVVTGYQGETVRAVFADYNPSPRWVEQPEQKGTADAVRCALPAVGQSVDTVVILYGDVPLLKKPVLDALIEQHEKDKAFISILTARLANPYGYGRIIRDRTGRIVRITEEADTDEEEKKIDEINTGICCIETGFLKEAIENLDSNNAQGEYYLTDIVSYAASKGLPAGSILVDEPQRALGVNCRKDLADAEGILRQEICTEWMLKGITIVDPATTYIDPPVVLGPDTRVEPGCHLRGNTSIGTDCLIEPGSIIIDSKIGNRARVRPYCLIQESELAEGCTVGPMAHLRPGTVLEKDVCLGNFVETKQTRVGQDSIAAHLTYLGDSEIGKNVNIGCGTITCNYDGTEKHQTIIEDNCFIGSDTQLIAPIRVGKGAYIGSGSTITEDVPKGALAVCRSRQEVTADWAKKRKKAKDKKEG